MSVSNLFFALINNSSGLCVVYRISHLLSHAFNIHPYFRQNLFCSNTFVIHNLPFQNMNESTKTSITVNHYQVIGYIAPEKNLAHKKNVETSRKLH